MTTLSQLFFPNFLPKFYNGKCVISPMFFPSVSYICHPEKLYCSVLTLFQNVGRLNHYTTL